MAWGQEWGPGETHPSAESGLGWDHRATITFAPSLRSEDPGLRENRLLGESAGVLCRSAVLGRTFPPSQDTVPGSVTLEWGRVRSVSSRSTGVYPTGSVLVPTLDSRTSGTRVCSRPSTVVGSVRIPKSLRVRLLGVSWGRVRGVDEGSRRPRAVVMSADVGGVSGLRECVRLFPTGFQDPLFVSPLFPCLAGGREGPLLCLRVSERSVVLRTWVPEEVSRCGRSPRLAGVDRRLPRVPKRFVVRSHRRRGRLGDSWLI